VITHRLVVGGDGTLDELEDKGVVAGNVSVHKRNPLIDQSGIRDSLTNECRIRS
jgi:hypothetical protein